MFERYPIHILNEDQRANLGIRRSELVRRCGFRNVAKGIRRLDALCGGYIGTLSAKAILAALPAALGLEAREVEKAVAEPADLISRAREQEEAKREAAWRASFKPSAYLVGTRSRPSSITIYGFGGGAERWLTIPLDLSQPPVTYAPRRSPSSGAYHRCPSSVRRRGSCPSTAKQPSFLKAFTLSQRQSRSP